MSGAQRGGLGCRYEFESHSLWIVFVTVVLHEITFESIKKKEKMAKV